MNCNLCQQPMRMTEETDDYTGYRCAECRHAVKMLKAVVYASTEVKISLGTIEPGDMVSVVTVPATASTLTLAFDGDSVRVVP